MQEDAPVTEHLPVYAGDQALDRLVAFCRRKWVSARDERNLRSFALVADPNTYAALGRAAEGALLGAGFDVRTVIVTGDDIGADEHAVYQVLLGLDKAPRTFVAVGSGTVTDVTRFVSHRSNSDFISLPTAASVDGYTSIGAPMIIDGYKMTINLPGADCRLRRSSRAVRRAPRADRGRVRRPDRQADVRHGLADRAPAVGRAVRRRDRAARAPGGLELRRQARRAGGRRVRGGRGALPRPDRIGLLHAGFRRDAARVGVRAPRFAFLGDEATAGGPPFRLPRREGRPGRARERGVGRATA